MHRTSSAADARHRAASHVSLGVWGAIGILAVVIAGFSIRALGDGPTPIDTWWHNIVVSSRTDVALALAKFLDTVGGVAPVALVTLVIVGVLLYARRFRDALIVVVAVGVCEAAAGVLKVVIARPRPGDSLADIGNASFPSGHTAGAAVLVAVLVLLLGRRFSIPAIVWVVLMAWSRTYLGAHWLTDVVAGAILGVSAALLARWLVEIASDRMLERRLEVATPAP